MLEKIQDGLKNTGPASIRRQFGWYIIISLLIFISLTTYTTIASTRAITEIHTEYAESTSRDFSAEITTLGKQMEGIFSFLQYDDAVQRIMKAESYRGIDGVLVSDVDMAVTTASQLNNMVADISLYNGTIAYSTIFGKGELEAMAAQLPSNSNMACLGIKVPAASRDNDTFYLTFGKKMYSDHREIATMYISVDMIFLFRKLPDASGRAFLLQDASGMLYSTAMSERLSLAADMFLTQQADSDAEHFSNILGCTIHRQALPSVNCTLISVLDTASMRGEEFLRIGSSWFFVILFVLFMLWSSLVFYHNYVNPIDRLNKTITYICEKHLRQLDGPLELNGCAELHAIGNNFTQMLRSMNDMNEKVMETSEQLYKMEIAKKSAEIAYLRTQINPHFLYNTLELIRAYAENGENKVVASAAVSIGKILRYSVKGGVTAPLREEIEVTKAYVSIQQAKRKTPVTTIYSIPASVRQIPVMKMLLQPMVENAFLHGLDTREEDAVLFISASRIDHMLCISVRDNGSGIAPERLQQLRAQLRETNPDTSCHLGLCNTHARIRLQYGAPYGIELDSTPDDGTRITLTLPTDREI